MPRTEAPPSYRLHKARHCAVVTIDGANHYLGRYGSAESYSQYLELISGWVTQRIGPQTQSPGKRDQSLTVGALILAYWQHAQVYYVKNGTPTDEQDGIQAALRPLRNVYGHTPVTDIGPRELKAVREVLIDKGLSRRVINQYIERIKRMFRWGVENELTPAGIYHALAEVAGLKKGRSRAREAPPIQPVPDQDIAAVRPHLSAVVWAMIEFQRLTGCRPGEVCQLRPGDVDRTKAIWCYRPGSHKTEHHGSERRIHIGPLGQAVLAPWLLRAADTYCFNPRESIRSEPREATLTNTGVDSVRRPRPGRRGDHYTSHSYRRAIERACLNAGIPTWAPNRLRHNRATELRQRYGLEAAQTVLGHRKADVTQIYAERDFQFAEKVMGEIG